MKKQYVKNLGQVSAIVFLAEEPLNKKILWWDTTVDKIKIYDQEVGEWVLLAQVLTDAKNIGEGEGLSYKGKDSGKLAFRSIRGVSGVEVETIDNEILIRLESYLRVQQSSVLIQQQKGSVGVLQIESNTQWKITYPNGKPKWVSLSKEAGNNSDSVLLTSLEANQDVSSREFLLELKDIRNKLNTVRVIVFQSGTNEANDLIITPSSWNLESDGGFKDFNVIVKGSSRDYIVNTQSTNDCRIIKNSATAFRIIISDNTNRESRSFEVELQHGADAKIKRKVLIHQSGMSVFEGEYAPLNIGGRVDEECHTI